MLPSHCIFTGFFVGCVNLALARVASGSGFIHRQSSASKVYHTLAARTVSKYGDARYARVLEEMPQDLISSTDHEENHEPSATQQSPKRQEDFVQQSKHQYLWGVCAVVNCASILLLILLAIFPNPRHLGYPLAIVAACNQGVMNLTLHVASRHGLSSGESFFWRSLLCTVLPYTLCWYNNHSIFPSGKIAWLFLRGLLGSLAVYGIFVSVSLIPLSHATAIYATFPFWTGLLAMCIFQEKVNCITGTLMLFSFVGVLLILQPFAFFQDFLHDAKMLGGIIAGLLGALFSAFAAIVIIFLGEDTSRLVVITWFGLVGLVLSPLFMLIEGGFFTYTRTCCQHSIAGWWPIIVIAVSALLLQLCYTWAIQISRAGPITSVFQFCELAFQWSLAAWLLGETLTWWIITGCVLVVASSLALYLAERGVDDGWVPESWKSPLPRAVAIVIRP